MSHVRIVGKLNLSRQCVTGLEQPARERATLERLARERPANNLVSVDRARSNVLSSHGTDRKFLRRDLVCREQVSEHLVSDDLGQVAVRDELGQVDPGNDRVSERDRLPDGAIPAPLTNHLTVHDTEPLVAIASARRRGFVDRVRGEVARTATINNDVINPGVSGVQLLLQINARVFQFVRQLGKDNLVQLLDGLARRLHIRGHLTDGILATIPARPNNIPGLAEVFHASITGLRLPLRRLHIRDHVSEHPRRRCIQIPILHHYSISSSSK